MVFHEPHSSWRFASKRELWSCALKTESLERQTGPCVLYRSRFPLTSRGIKWIWSARSIRCMWAYHSHPLRLWPSWRLFILISTLLLPSLDCFCFLLLLLLSAVTLCREVPLSFPPPLWLLSKGDNELTVRVVTRWCLTSVPCRGAIVVLGPSRNHPHDTIEIWGSHQQVLCSRVHLVLDGHDWSTPCSRQHVCNTNSKHH